MKETTAAITWSTEGKPGDFSPQKRKKQLQGKKNLFFLLSACRYFQNKGEKTVFYQTD